MLIAITGSSGMIGLHIAAHLKAHRCDDILTFADRETFKNKDRMEAFLSNIDVLVHCAADIRSQTDDIVGSNFSITSQLTTMLDSTGSKATIIYTNSTAAVLDTPYGKAKRKVSELLSASCNRRGAKYFDLILPNVFGEFGKPFHNSVVATFCKQILLEEKSRIDSGSEIQLIHASRAAQVVLDILENLDTQSSGVFEVRGEKILVDGIFEKLRRIHDQYIHGVIPEHRGMFDRDLFNVYRHHSFCVSPIKKIQTFSDERGSLFETVRTAHPGQAFVSTTVPGIVRGNHFHIKKFERFVVLSGVARVKVRPLFRNSLSEFILSDTDKVSIDIPTLHTHSIENISNKNLITMFWADEFFDKKRPDTFFEEV